MVELREAYETLIDPIKRKSYDETLRKIQAQEALRQAQEASRQEKEENSKTKLDKAAQQHKKIIYTILGFFIIIIVIAILLIHPKEPEQISSETVSESPTLQDSELVSNESNDAVSNDAAVETTKSLEEQIRLLHYDDSLLGEAIKDLFVIADDYGLIGLREKINDCYSNNKNKKYCFTWIIQ